MSIKYSVVFKTLFSFVFVLYTIFFPITSSILIIDAILVLFFSLYFLSINHKNPEMILLVFFLFYSNYSIVISEYLVKGDLSVPYTQVKTFEVYGITLRIMLLFNSLLAIYYKPQTWKVESVLSFNKRNDLIFWGMLVIIIISIIFGVQRELGLEYQVNVNTLYGYLPIFFLFAIYYKGHNRQKDVLLFILMIIAILQDFYYGGRITSLQILLLFVLTYFRKYITIRSVFVIGAIGITIFHVVSFYRSTGYSLNNFNLSNLIRHMVDTFFVFDTPVGAYYASATHVKAYDLSNFSFRMESFFEFFKSIFLGTERIELSDVTRVASYYYNLSNGGGGLIFTHFFFWFGWLGPIFTSLGLSNLLMKLQSSKHQLSGLIFTAIVIRTPAWYLYSPTNILRGAIFVVCIVWFACNLFDSLPLPKIITAKSSS